jgi:hypothetical protein
MKVLSRTDLAGMQCTATFSDDLLYRQELVHRWSDAPLLTTCGLNPSTATHEHIDPTMAGMIKRARMWGYGGHRMLNLHDLRATDPRVMKAHPRPCSADNDIVIRLALRSIADDGAPLLAAWGAHGSHRARDRAVIRLIQAAGVQLMALEINADGSPKHPLYIKHDVRPAPWLPV